MNRLILSILIHITLAFSVYAGDKILPTGTILSNSPRDIYTIGTPLTSWGSEQDAGGHWCGTFGGWCLTNIYLTPYGATNYSFKDTDGSVYTIYKTTDPNVGVVYGIRDPSQTKFTPAVGTQRIQFFSSSALTTYSSFARARLVYIGNSLRTSSSFSIQRGTKIGTVTTNANGDEPDDLYLATTTINVSPITCTLESGTNRSINLGDIKESALSTIGSYGTNVSFDFRILCPAGVTLYAGLTDVNEPSNRSQTLSISQFDGAAQGVGVQVFGYGDGGAMRYGPGESLIGSPGLVPITGKLSDPMSYFGSFTARIVRTGPLKPGKVKALMGVVLSYQ